MNPFHALDQVQSAYLNYVTTFQKFKNPAIRDWVLQRVQGGTLLWKDPFIQLNRRWERGESFESLVNAGVLHPATPHCFTVERGNRAALPLAPHAHQSRAVRSILGDRANTIIATGTSSGKSFCFGIPIVSECLRLREQNVAGIKAVIVYPMNALANSQYEDFAHRLHGSGLKIALYTGDTPYSPEEGIAFLKETTGRDQPYDCELLSRREIQDTPPDILMTNYVQLELLLTRFEDRKLFPTGQRGVLRFLVLDEVHTYTGKRGADVAALIRRLKQHTGAIGQLRCIGTSATVQSGAGEDERQLVADFASRLFGEPFTREHVIREEYAPLVGQGAQALAPEIAVTDDMLRQFDGSVSTAMPLVAALVGRDLNQPEKTVEGFGQLLAHQATLSLIEEKIAERAWSLNELTEEYRKTLRPDESLDACRREVMAALQVGMVARVVANGANDGDQQTVPLLLPKLHAFFSQGRAITACLTPQGPHLNDRGEQTCPVCAHQGRQRDTLPLNFCRACGQEFYGVAIADDGTVAPREMDSLEYVGRAAYLYPARHDPEQAPFPDNWFTPKTHKPRKDYADSIPQNAVYCPVCNRIDPAPACNHADRLDVCIVPMPLLLCPSCGVTYDRRTREFNKLFTFGSVGRSTATDVLVGNTLANLPTDERKIIAFSDNRQDTALQAAHLNNLQKRVLFRRSLYRAFAEGGFDADHGNWLELSSVGLRIFRAQDKYGVLPPYSREKGKYRASRAADKQYQDYLTYAILQDLAATQQRNHQNLEDAGVLVVAYDGIDRIAEDEAVWAALPALARVPPDVRRDYLVGFLDIMRRELAIDHPFLTNPYEFDVEVRDKLNEAVFFDAGGYGGGPVGFSDDAPTDDRRATMRRFTTGRAFVNWTRRALNVDRDTATDLIPAVVAALKHKEAGFLVEREVRPIGPLTMLPLDILLFQVTDERRHWRCPKCGLVHHFKTLRVCTGVSCANLTQEDFGDNYFLCQYTTPLDQAVKVEAEEHSGQVSGTERKTIEARFRDPKDSLNAIICTPTMELGIDIGQLTSVFMRNVPPNPSNYAQRAGRAGRKGQPSLISVFCGVGSYRGPHDQYFYRHPDKIIAGKISVPRFLLDNQALMTTHIHSLILETIEERLPSQPAEILDLSRGELPLYTDFEETFRRKVDQNHARIVQAVKQAFTKEQAAFAWFTDKFIESILVRFVDDLDAAFGRWRVEYRRLQEESDDIHRRTGQEGPNKALSFHKDIVDGRMAEMRDGQGAFYAYRYLGAEGFLPNYAFPRLSTILSFYDTEDQIERDPTLALREFAPGNSVYYRGNRYLVTHARPRTQQNRLAFEKLLVCKHCGAAYLGQDAEGRVACAVCGNSLVGTHPNPHTLDMPDMFARKQMRITADEEERTRLGYLIDPHYQMGQHVERCMVKANGVESLRLTYEHNGRIIMVNRGTRQSEKEEEELGFVYCLACNRWLFGDDNIENHVKPDSDRSCPKRARRDQIVRRIELYTHAQHDVVTVDCPLPAELASDQSESFYVTLRHALEQALAITLDLDDNEVASFLMPNPSAPNQFRLVLYETTEGGNGSVRALTEATRLQQVIERAREILHEGEQGCEKACYDCLCHFYNQIDHELLDRRLVLPFLQSLTALTVEPAEDSEAGPTFEELEALCQSEFEKQVLREIRQRGLPLPDAAQKVIYEGDAPVASSDFFYAPRTLVFVDGSPHYRDYVAAADQTKRRRLKAMGYRIIAITGETIDEALEQLTR